MPPSKRRTRTRTVVVHECNQEVYLNRINTVLFGNGHPEDGLAFMFRAFLEKEKSKEADIAEIKKQVGEAVGSAMTAKHALELYQKEMEGREKQQKIENDKKTFNWDKTFKVLGSVLALITLIVMAYFQWKSSGKMDDVEKRVYDQGTPVVTDTRGRPIQGAEVRFWPKDFEGDTTNADTTKIDTINIKK